MGDKSIRLDPKTLQRDTALFWGAHHHALLIIHHMPIPVIGFETSSAADMFGSLVMRYLDKYYQILETVSLLEKIILNRKEKYAN